MAIQVWANTKKSCQLVSGLIAVYFAITYPKSDTKEEECSGKLQNKSVFQNDHEDDNKKQQEF